MYSLVYIIIPECVSSSDLLADDYLKRFFIKREYHWILLLLVNKYILMSNKIKSRKTNLTRNRKENKNTLWKQQVNIYRLTCHFGGTWEGVTVLCGWLGLWGGLPCWSCAWEQGDNLLNPSMMSVINNISATFRNQFLASIFNDSYIKTGSWNKMELKVFEQNWKSFFLFGLCLVIFTPLWNILF